MVENIFGSRKMEPLQLCTRINGVLILEEENLQKIPNISDFNSDVPLAIISFIGEKGSGKTTYTNLLIQNLRHNSTNGWLEKVTVKSNTGETLLPGFLIPKNSKGTETSNVSLWPEAFYLRNRGKKVMVLVVHAQYSNNDPQAAEVDSLEVFLSLLSSKIVEVHRKKREFRFLSIYRDLMKLNESFYGDLICNDTVSFFRTEMKPLDIKQTTAVDEEASKSLRNLITCKSMRVFLENIEGVAIAHIPDKTQSFQNVNGYLKLTTVMYDAIYNSINMVADDERLVAKTILKKKTKLQAGEFAEYIKICMHVTNSVMEKHAAESIFQSPSCQNQSKERGHPKFDENGNETDDAVSETIQDENGNETDDAVSETIQDENGNETDDAVSKTIQDDKGKSTSPNFPEEALQAALPSSDEEQHEVNMDCSENLTIEPMIQPTPANLHILDLLLKGASETLAKVMNNWNKSDPNFKCADILRNCIGSAALQHCEVTMLKETERNWLYGVALDKLLELNMDLVKVENILQAFNVTKNMASNEYNALHLLIGFDELQTAVSQSKYLTEFPRKFILAVSNTCIGKYLNEHRSSDIFFASVEQIRAFCTNEMQRYVVVGPYSKSKFKNLHIYLFRKCISTLIAILGSCMQRDLSECRNSIGRFLLPKLNGDLLQYRRQNMSMLLKLQKKLSSVIAKSKVMYDEKIVLEITQKSPMIRLQAVHDSARHEALQYLKLQIGQQISPNEPLECHLLTLASFIDADWNMQRNTYTF